jgi:hypothetical protein
VNDHVKRVQVSPGGHKIARRSVVAGAAWTVPAVVVGTAVPAWAGLSQTQPPVEITNVVCCKFSNENVYHFELTWTSNQHILYTELSNMQFLLQPSSGAVVGMPTVDTKVFAPLESHILVVNSAVSTNSASFELYYKYHYVRSTSSTMSPVYDSGDWPAGGGWSPQVGTFNNTPDCSAVKTDQYSAYQDPNYSHWVS